MGSSSIDTPPAGGRQLSLGTTEAHQHPRERSARVVRDPLLPSQSAPQDRDLGPDTCGAGLSSQTPDLEDKEVP